MTFTEKYKSGSNVTDLKLEPIGCHICPLQESMTAIAKLNTKTIIKTAIGGATSVQSTKKNFPKQNLHTLLNINMPRFKCSITLKALSSLSNKKA